MDKAERDDLLRIFSAIYNLQDALQSAYHRGSLTDFDKSVAITISAATEELSRVWSILLNVNLGNEGEPDEINRWNELARWEQITNRENGAWFYLDRCLGGINSARHATADPAVRGWLSEADSNLARINRALLYEREPPPAGDVWTVVGPHGIYDLTMKRLFFSCHYLRRWVNGLIEDPRRLVDMGQFTNVIVGTHRAMAMIAGVFDITMDEFCRVLAARKMLWTEVAKAYHALLGSSGALLGGDKGTDAWFHMDLATEASDRFPNKPASLRCPGV